MNIYLYIIDMDNQENKIKLHLYDPHHYHPRYCTFNLKGEFILYSEVNIIDNVEAKRNRKLNFDSSDKKIIWVYSTKTKNEWFCKGIYKIPDDFELIGISKYDKFYLRSLRSNNYYYE